MEVAFGQEAYGTQFDGFMRHYLTLKTGEIPNVRAVYEAFKRHAQVWMESRGGVAQLLAEIHRYAGYYCAMALDKEPDKDLAQAFRDLRDLKVNVAYPFLLELYDDHAQARLSRDDFVCALRLVESYVFRRAVCDIPTNSLNKTFMTFGRSIRKDRYRESIQAYLLTLPSYSYRCFPGDEEFKRELSRRDLYNFPRRSYWLRRLENHGRKERVPVDEYTIEHILPQNPNLNTQWQEERGHRPGHPRPADPRHHQAVRSGRRHGRARGSFGGSSPVHRIRQEDHHLDGPEVPLHPYRPNPEPVFTPN